MPSECECANDDGVDRRMHWDPGPGPRMGQVPAPVQDQPVDWLSKWE